MITEGSPQVALITGGNSGIGKHTAIGLASKGYRVIITSRDAQRGADALAEIKQASGRDDVECMSLDLASFESVRRCAQEFLDRFDRLDVLVNNAGLMLDQHRTTEEGFEMTFGVNHLGHFLLTQLLLERLKASVPSRIVNLSSDAHKGARKGLNFDDLHRERGYSGFGVYCESKLANIYFTRELARRLDGTGVTVNAVHPGVVRSGFARDGDVSGIVGGLFSLVRPFMLSEAKGARTSIHVATSSTLEGETGGYYARSRPSKISAVAKDADAAERLWELSEMLIAETEI